MTGFFVHQKPLSLDQSISEFKEAWRLPAVAFHGLGVTQTRNVTSASVLQPTLKTTAGGPA